MRTLLSRREAFLAAVAGCLASFGLAPRARASRAVLCADTLASIEPRTDGFPPDDAGSFTTYSFDERGRLSSVATGFGPSECCSFAR